MDQRQIVLQSRPPQCGEIVRLFSWGTVRRWYTCPLHGRRRAIVRHRLSGWVAELRDHSAREHLRGTLPSGQLIPMRPRRLFTWLCHCGRRILLEIILLTLDLRLLPLHVVSARTAVSPCIPILVCSESAQGSKEHRWRHIERLLFEYPGISGLGGSPYPCPDVLLRTCAGSDPAKAVFFATVSSDRALVRKLQSSTADMCATLQGHRLAQCPPGVMITSVPSRIADRLSITMCPCSPGTMHALHVHNMLWLPRTRRSGRSSSTLLLHWN